MWIFTAGSVEPRIVGLPLGLDPTGPRRKACMAAGLGQLANVLCWPELILGFLQLLLGFRQGKQPMAHRDPMLDDDPIFDQCFQEEIRVGRWVNLLRIPASVDEGGDNDCTIFFVHGSMANMQQFEGQVRHSWSPAVLSIPAQPTYPP